jgi:hypothetical protein
MKGSLNAGRDRTVVVGLAMVGVVRVPEDGIRGDRVRGGRDNAREGLGPAVVVREGTDPEGRAAKAIEARVQGGQVGVRDARMIVVPGATIAADFVDVMIGGMIFRRLSPRRCASIFFPSLLR